MCQVDARLLYKTLREACVRSQVTILEGQDATAEVTDWQPHLTPCHQLRPRSRAPRCCQSVWLTCAWCGGGGGAQAVVFHPVNPAVKSVRLRDGRRLQFDKVRACASEEGPQLRQGLSVVAQQLT